MIDAPSNTVSPIFALLKLSTTTASVRIVPLTSLSYTVLGSTNAPIEFVKFVRVIYASSHGPII